MIKKFRQFCIFDTVRWMTLFIIAAFVILLPVKGYAQPDSDEDTAQEYVELDISKGSIVITEDGYCYGNDPKATFSGVYLITGRSNEAYGVEVAGGTHTLVFKDLVIDQRTLQDCFPLVIDKNACVNLNLHGDNVLYAGSGNSGIFLESGAALDMDGYGNGSLSMLAYPVMKADRVFGARAVEVADGASISYPTAKEGILVELYGGMNRKDYSQIFAYSGQPYLRIEFSNEHTEHVLSAEPDCRHDQICTLCGVVVGEKKSHTPGAPATCTKPQVCTVCGATIREALDHKGVWKVMEYMDYGLYRRETMICNICGETLSRIVVVDNQ